jgi:hypothetical protein
MYSHKKSALQWRNSSARIVLMCGWYQALLADTWSRRLLASAAKNQKIIIYVYACKSNQQQREPPG